MKFMKKIISFWGDILFLLLYPLALAIYCKFITSHSVDKTQTLFLFVAHVIFAVIAFICLFVLKNRPVLRYGSYLLYALLVAVSMLLYYLAVPELTVPEFTNSNVRVWEEQHEQLARYAASFLTLAGRTFVGSSSVRIGLSLIKRRARKKAEKP